MSKLSKSNNPLLIAGGTLLFYMCAIPIADSISAWMQTFFNERITKLQCSIAQNQKQADIISNSENKCSHAIGFNFPEESYEVEYEEN